MSTSESGLLDTSVFIARETGRAVGKLPERVTVSVVTIGELKLGVINASDTTIRSRRVRTLETARLFDPIPVTETVIENWAQLVSDCRSAGIHRAVKLTDALIAATAITYEVAVVTQDNDFDQIAYACPTLVVHKV